MLIKAFNFNQHGSYDYLGLYGLVRFLDWIWEGLDMQGFGRDLVEFVGINGFMVGIVGINYKIR